MVLRLLAGLVLLCISGSLAAAAAAGPSRDPFVLVEVHRHSGPWYLLVRSAEGRYEKVDASGTVALAGNQIPAPLAAHAPGNAGILYVSLADALTSDRDGFFNRRFVPALARYLRVSEDELRIKTPKLTGSPIGEDLLKARGDIDPQQMFLPFISSYESLRAELQSRDRDTRTVAVNAVSRIPGSRATGLLIAALESGDEIVRDRAEREISRRGPDALALLRTSAAAADAPQDRVVQALHRIEYNAATSAGGAAAYSDFLRRYPQSRFSIEIQYRLLSANGDVVGLKKLVDSLPNGGGGSLHDLLDAGSVELVARGNTRTVRVYEVGGIGHKSIRYAPQMSVTLRRRVPYPMQVRVPVGTYFANSSARPLETMVISDTVVELIAEEVRIDIPAVYVNRFFERPDDSNLQFGIQRAPSDARLRALLTVMTAAQPGASIWQAAAWIVGGNFDYGTMSLVQRYSTRNGASSPMISDDDIVAALRFCEAAQIDVSRTTVWPIKARFAASVSDESNRQWLTRILSSDVAGDAARAFARIESYELGATTVQAFLADGWTLTDAVSGRIGIVAFLKAGDRSEYILGTCGRLQDARFQIDEDQRRRATQFLWPDGPTRDNGARSNAQVPVRCEKVYHLKFENAVLQSRAKPSAAN